MMQGHNRPPFAPTIPVVFKKLCHFTKLFTIEGMTPCKTLTLMKL